jgi:hypothetical protein
VSGDRRDIGPGSLPVEELPDVSWQRIERRLFARLAAAGERGGAPVRPALLRRRTWLVAGGALVAAAAAAALVIGGRGGDQPAQPPAPRSPSRIATADAPSAVSVGDVSLEIAPQSALLVDEDRDRGVLFVLERGETTFRVAPVGDRPPVVVQAGDVRVEVIGTAFAVSRQGDSARVVVYEGVVSLVQKGERRRLTAGSVWPGAPAPAPAPPAPIDDVGEPADPIPGPDTPAAPAPGGRRPHTDRNAASAPLAAPSLTDKDRYQNAQKLEQSAPDRARALYADLVRRGGVWAPNALYAHALLEERLGNRAAARKLLQRYLARYPDGPNATDARALLDEAGASEPPRHTKEAP